MPPQLPKLGDFQRLPFRLQVGAVALGVVLLGLGGYAGLIVPREREVKALKLQLARQEPPPLLSDETVPPITEEERKLWRELEGRLRQRFPDDKNLPAALQAVADLARASRMELVALNLQSPVAAKTPVPSAVPAAAPPPSPLKPPPPLAVSPTVIKLTAFNRYRDLVQFLEGLGSLPVALTVGSMEVKRVEGRLSTEITLVTFRWRSP